MARGPSQKLKLLYLMQIFTEKTDENHHLTVPELIEELSRLGVGAERKSIYDDLETLKLFGLDIERARGRRVGYYLASRTFELPELKLLVDSVASSKFITHAKSAQLIGKLESLCSRQEARALQRQVYVAGRVKTMNESVYYNVDKIHAGIGAGRQISFRYFEYAVSKEKVYRRDGGRYVISPLALTRDDENYYMIGYDAPAGMVKHYRVDKMADIQLTEKLREGLDLYGDFDVAVYSKKHFSMFGGQEETVRIEFENRLIGVVLDRFGRDIIPVTSGSGRFVVAVDVVVSPQFLAWVAGFGGEAKILSPEGVAGALLKLAREVAAQYAG